ncbi:MAG: hypothetical protein A3I09_02750 [Deltaproteobacteria bacterium RIFCSPLOWO2_02_FULL_47_10]|nr:MAG: hypothetical protein A3I09_02750 [Deltaproteobacteria bacterium RIFCSPLOWO2_02_FULL_47_10]
MLLASCFALLTSCQFRVPKDPFTFIDSIPADPDSLNPIISIDSMQTGINRLIYESLIKLDNTTLKPRPLLAKSWMISKDHLQYTFYLRNDVFWHDGMKFMADDVLYTFEQIRNPNVDAAAARVDLQMVDKFEKLDDYTVRFTFKKPDYKGILFVGMIRIIPKHVFDNGSDFNSHPAGRYPVGTGPYRFVEWRTGKHIILERNESYWGERPDIKRVVHKIISDSNATFQVLKKGELDVGTLRPIQWARQADTKEFNSRFNKHEYYLPICTFIGWNLERPFFKDRRVRTALTHLINREGIKKKMTLGKSKVLTSCFDINDPEYNNNIQPYPYNPEYAKRLLTEAGWVDHNGDGILDKDGVSFQFALLYGGGDAASTRMLTIIREDLEHAGIVMDIQGLEGATLYQQVIERKFGALISGWVNTPNSDPYQIWHSSQINGGSNFIGFSNKEFDELLIKARQEFDDNKRIAMYHRMQEILHEEQPYTFLFAPASLVAIDKRFSNVKVYPRGISMIEWIVKQ